MKKLVVAMLVAAMAVPAFAAVVTVTPMDNGDGTVSVWMNAGDVEVRGIALKVTTSAGAKLVSVDSDWTVKTEFNTFIDYLTTVDIPTTVVGETPAQEGHPFAVWPGVPGGGVAAVDATEFSVSMGALDPDGTQFGYFSPVGGDVILTFKTGAGQVCFELDTTRGGLVGDSETPIVVDFTNGGCVTVTEAGPQEALKPSHPAYNDWVAFGKPDCWAYIRNCRGDADGKKQLGDAVPVFTDDLAIFLAAYGQPDSNLGANGICADFNRASQLGGAVRVFTDDLAVFLAAYGQPTANVAECDGTHMNFWITP